MNSLIQLIIALAVMMVVAIGGGLIPIKFGGKLPGFNYFSYFGMGILIGTSLVIIIPEGVKTMFEAVANPPGWYIGLPLVVGFVAMYFQDNIPLILEALNLKGKYTYNDISESPDGFSVGHGLKSILQSSLTLGLLLHGFIDGISIGLLYALDHSNLGLIMFLVIIIHKLPTAFSFTSILLKEGFLPAFAQFHLVLFSLTTPIAAICTYAVIKFGINNSQVVIAVLFMFSAGTFLYVIHHVMSLMSPREDSSDIEHNSTSTVPQNRAVEFGATLVGIMVPIVVSLVGGDE